MAFGLSQLGKKTPTWAKLMVGLTVAATTSIAIWVGGTNLLTDAIKFEAILVLKCIDPLVYFFGEFFGVPITKKDIHPQP